MSGGVDIVVDGVVAIVEAVVHIADPVERQRKTRELVASERAKWAALDPGLESVRADAITAAHHVDPATEHVQREARSEDPTVTHKVPPR